MLSVTWRSLWHRPAQTVIALIQSTIGALIVILTITLAFAQSKMSASSELAQLTAGTRTKNMTSIFNVFSNADLKQLIKLSPDIAQLDLLNEEYVSSLEVGINRFKISGSIATGPEYPTLSGLKVLHGTYFNRRDVDSGARVLAISANAARVLYGREDAVGETLKVNMGITSKGAIPYRVVAITESANPRLQSVASPLMLPIAVTGYNNKASSLLLRAQPGRLANAKEQLLRGVEQMYQRDPQVQSVLARGEKSFFYSAVGNPFASSDDHRTPLLQALYAVAALTVTVSSLGVLATLLAGVNQRAREQGLRRALGANRIQIVSGLLLEAASTTLWGCLLGIAIAAKLIPLLNTVFSSTFQESSLVFSPTLAGAVLGLFVGLSLLFGLLPAILGTRLRPTEALRMQG